MEKGFDGCPMGIKHEEQIKNLSDCYILISKDVKDIKERLLARPSWIVSIIIAFLSTLAFSALTFSFTVLHAMTIGK